MTAVRSLALAVGVVMVVSACSGVTTPSPAASSGRSVPADAAATPAAANVPLTVYGAASLSAVLAKMKVAWEAAHPGATLTISTDSSSALETQIEQGAPADVFLSADTTNPKKLTAKGLADGSAQNFAGNLLTVIVPAANPARISSPADLARPGVKVIAAGDDVPITKYANQLVANLATESGDPAKFQAGYAANIASKEDNVKAVVAKIALGEGDAAVVYVTDARAEPKVATIEVPPAANVPATYAGVVTKASANAATAHAFLDWVAGPDGQSILASFGFLPPAPG